MRPSRGLAFRGALGDLDDRWKLEVAEIIASSVRSGPERGSLILEASMAKRYSRRPASGLVRTPWRTTKLILESTLEKPRQPQE